jgi:hypothetical protein
MEFEHIQELDVANMIIELCSQEMPYQRFYMYIEMSIKLCKEKKVWANSFSSAFETQYSAIIPKLAKNKLTNVATFFSELFLMMHYRGRLYFASK